MRELQHSPDLLVADFVKWVQVHPQGPGEQHWILRPQGLDKSLYHLDLKAVCGFELLLLLLLLLCIRYLWYYCEPASEVVQAYCGNIYVINEDTTFSSFNDSKQAVG